MADGRKTGGRKKGALNKRTQDVIDRLSALGCDPIEGMARIAMNAENPPELRGRMYAELAQYVAPKRKAIEHSGEVTTQYAIGDTPQLSKEEWQKQFGTSLH